VIGRLTGLVVERAADGTCVLDVQGVGYEVLVPLRSLAALPAPPARTTLQVHTHVREDALRLFGFESEADRTAFRTMLGISGVATKLALAVLSELDAAALGAVVARGDHKRLTSIAGIGKKTAERMVLELRDKVHALSGTAGSATGAGLPSPAYAPALGGRAGEVAAALASLGFSRGQAEAAAGKVVSAAGDERPLETLIRQALQTLS